MLTFYRNITQIEIAKKLGISQPAVSIMLNRQHNREPATVSSERPTAENKETQPTRVLYMDRLSYRSCIRISP
jgi:predicted transcriptional regulator